MMNPRMKAMDANMKEMSPDIVIALKKKMNPDMHGSDQQDQQGMISMMVTPEEKQMLLDQRAKEEGSESKDEMMKEQQEGESPADVQAPQSGY